MYEVSGWINYQVDIQIWLEGKQLLYSHNSHHRELTALNTRIRRQMSVLMISLSANHGTISRYFIWYFRDLWCKINSRLLPTKTFTQEKNYLKFLAASSVRGLSAWGFVFRAGVSLSSQQPQSREQCIPADQQKLHHFTGKSWQSWERPEKTKSLTTRNEAPYCVWWCRQYGFN